MLDRNEIEIFNQLHEMYAEGKHINRPSESIINLVLINEGYYSNNIDIYYDSLMGLYQWRADIQKVS